MVRKRNSVNKRSEYEPHRGGIELICVVNSRPEFDDVERRSTDNRPPTRHCDALPNQFFLFLIFALVCLASRSEPERSLSFRTARY